MALALERWNQNLVVGCVFLVYAACGLLLCTIPIYGVVAVAITVYGAAHGFLNGGNYWKNTFLCMSCLILKKYKNIKLISLNN